MLQILAALGAITDTMKSVTSVLSGIGDKLSAIAEFGMTGAGGVGLKGAKMGFEALENLPIFKNNGVSFGAKTMTPFGTLMYWNEVEKVIRSNNQSLGIAGVLTKQIENNIIAAGTASMRLGFSEKEIVESFKDFIEEYNRNPLLSEDELQRITTVRQAFGVGAEKIFAINKQYGQSIEDTYNFIDDVNKSTDKFGLNSKKVLTQIQNQISLIDRFNFKNGEKGLSNMVIQAERLGIKLEAVAGFAEKVMNPEGALDTAAQLQMLGGEFAKIGDPFQLMYDSSNDLESFSKKIGNLAKNTAFLNKETGQFELNPLDMRRLRVGAEITGQSLEDITKQAKLLAKEDYIGKILNPELRGLPEIDKAISKLSGIADFKNNTVNIGNRIVEIAKLKREDLEGLSQITVSGEEKDSVRGLIESNMTLIDTLRNTTNQLVRAMNPREAALMEGGAIKSIIDVVQDSLDNQNGNIRLLVDTVAAFRLDAANSVATVITATLTKGIEGGLKAMWENMDLNSPNNAKSKEAIIKAAGGADSKLGGFVDGFFDVQSQLHDGIESFVSAVGDFGSSVYSFMHGGKSQNGVKLSNVSKIKDLDSGNLTVTGSGFSTVRNEAITDYIKLGGKLPELNTNYQNKNGETGELIELFKKDELARKEFEKQVSDASDIVIRSEGKSHIIEFGWNGKVFNAYNLFDDPKFIELLNKDVNQTVAQHLLSTYRNQGKTTSPTMQNPKE